MKGVQEREESEETKDEHGTEKETVVTLYKGIMTQRYTALTECSKNRKITDLRKISLAQIVLDIHVHLHSLPLRER